MRGDPTAELDDVDPRGLEYRRAVQAYIQWFRLWEQSRDLAHRNIAYACFAIARETQAAVQFQVMAARHTRQARLRHRHA